MSTPDPAPIDERREEAARWVKIAAEDERVARICLELDDPALTAAAYHCQQAAEKLMKAMLIVAAVRPRRIHDLAALGDVAGQHFPLARLLLARFAPLTGWASDFRYPGDEPGADMPPHSYAIRDALANIRELAVLVDALTTPT
jgi:HEPN domain-containing protein